MQQNLELLKQLKKELHDSAPKIEGMIKATDKSFGFLETSKGKSYFVPPPQMKKVLHGDLVTGTLQKDGDKEYIELDTLTETTLNRFVARVTYYKDKLQVTPDHHLLKKPLPAFTAMEKGSLKEGDWVVAVLKQHGLRDGRFRTEVTDFICSSDDPSAPWLISLARHSLPSEALETDQDFQLQEETTERRDLSELPLFTIDSASTRDMDDALYVSARDEGGWTLTVAIADPSAYIALNSETDQEAAQRGYTTYLPGRNIPMLPRQLSDELCSLQEGQKRPALCCQVDINQDGAIASDATFFTAWITSAARLTYEDVSNWLEQGESLQHPESVLNALSALKELAEQSLNWRQANSIVYPDRPDYRFKLDSEGKVFAIVADQRRVAHKMVEEAMVIANISAASFLKPHGLGMFNTHAGFEAEKLEEAVAVITEQGYEVSAEELATLSGYAKFRRQLISKNNLWLEARLRRYQSYVLTRNEPGSHYGMGLEGYATWTSPIRKYSDLLNHQLIKQLLTEAPDLTALQQAMTAERGEQLDQQKVHNRLAERDTNQWLYSEFLQGAVEEKTVFEGEIFDISRGGMRVRLLENGAAPFIPGSMIHKERKEMTLDNNSGQVFIKGEVCYRLGDTIRVQLIKADTQRRSLLAKPLKASDQKDEATSE